MGESFVTVEKDSVEQFFESEKAELEKDLQGKEEEVELIQQRMKQLKAVLYAKFGRAINLEEKEGSQ